MAGFDPDVFGAGPANAPASFDKYVFNGSNLRRNIQVPVPAEDPGFWNSVMIGAGKTTDSILNGFTQMYLGAKGEDSALNALKQKVRDDAEPYRELQKVRPFATGIGEALPSMAVPVGAGATTLGTVGRMFLAGAVPAALEYGSPAERAVRAGTAGVASAAVPIGVTGVKTLGSLAEPLYEGGRRRIAARTLNRVAGDEAATVAGRLTNAQPIVPGSIPTAAQVAENGGIAALERAAQSSNPTPFTTRAMEQSSARLSALRGVAKDKAALSAAETARDAATSGLYQQADAALVPVDAELKKLLGRMPGGQVQSAMNLARVSGKPLQMGKDIPASFVAATDASGAPVLQDIAAQPGQFSGKGLHYIKLALDDALSNTGESAFGDTMKRAVTGLKRDYLGYVDNAIPAYGQARTKFAELSKPVNQMEIGQDLYNKVAPALADYGALGRETGATYARALRDADATAARVTGFPNAKMADIMTPSQMQTLEGVARDLARKANAQDLGRGPGSNTFQNLSMQNIAEQSGMPRMTRGLLSLPGVNRATSWLYRDTDQKIQGLLADALLDPATSGKLMTDAQRKLLQSNPKTRALLEQSLVRGGGLLGLSLAE